VISEDEEVFVTGRRAAGSVVARQLLARSNGTPTGPIPEVRLVRVRSLGALVRSACDRDASKLQLSKLANKNIQFSNLLWVNTVEIPTNYAT
jgi:hypothetical protein